MSKKIFYLFGIIITIIFGTVLYMNFCCNCQVKKPVTPVQLPVIKEQESKKAPFILKNVGLDYQTSDNFKYLKNSSTMVMPISDSITIGIEKLKAFLIANPEQKITIIGYCVFNEKNTTSFENLGLARANDIKTFFVSKGLTGSQFDLKGKVLDQSERNLVAINLDTLVGPIQYNLKSIETNTETTNKWGVLKEKINKNPLIIHFGTNKATDNLNIEDHHKVIDIAEYMKNVTDANLLVVGHSDNVGNRDLNINLGKKRAEFTKKYLVKNGIQASKITTESKGSDEPIQENNTAEGRANNRRTVITIQ